MNESTKKVLPLKYLLILLGGVALLVILIAIAYITSSPTKTTSSNNSSLTAAPSSMSSTASVEESSEAYFSKTKIKVTPNSEYNVDLSVNKTADTLIQGYEINLTFDKTKVAITSIIFNTGVATAGLSDTSDNLTAVNSRGTLKLIGEIQSGSGFKLSANTEVKLINIKFKSLTSSTSTIALSTAKSSYLYIVNTSNAINKSAITVKNAVDLVQ